MRVLVTGANGLAGSAIVRRALAAGHEPVALIRPGSDETLLPPDVERLHWEVVHLSAGPSEWTLRVSRPGEEGPLPTSSPGDRTDEAARLLSWARADALIHCAAVVSTGKPDISESLRVNVELTATLLEAAGETGLPRWVQVSSMSANPRNRSVYGGTKWLQEKSVRESHLSWSVLRPGLIYGPERRGIFARLAHIVAEWSIIPLPNGGGQPAAAVHEEDFADAAVRAAESDAAAGKCFELGGPEQWSFRQLVEEMAGVLGRKPVLLPLPLPLCRIAAFTGEALLPNPPLTTDNLEGILQARWPDISAAQEVLGFAPRPFRDGFRKCLKQGLLPKARTRRAGR